LNGQSYIYIYTHSPSRIPVGLNMDTIGVITPSTLSHNALRESPAMDEPRSRGTLVAGHAAEQTQALQESNEDGHDGRSTVDLVEVSIEMSAPLPHKATSHG